MQVSRSDRELSIVRISELSGNLLELQRPGQYTPRLPTSCVPASVMPMTRLPLRTRISTPSLPGPSSIPSAWAPRKLDIRRLSRVQLCRAISGLKDLSCSGRWLLSFANSPGSSFFQRISSTPWVTVRGSIGNCGGSPD
jgi:hypothetical protein